MSWKFHESTRVGAESALDACDYFVDEVIEPWKVLGAEKGSGRGWEVVQLKTSLRDHEKVMNHREKRSIFHLLLLSL
jgi:uncharacterized protein YggL (DUF469 family)